MGIDEFNATPKEPEMTHYLSTLALALAAAFLTPRSRPRR